MEAIQLPLTIEIADNVEITVHEIEWFTSPSQFGEGEIGQMLISDNHQNKKENYAIWFGDEGNHYVCLPTYEEEEEELEVFLYEDLVS
jgi:hypothetical protein